MVGATSERNEKSSGDSEIDERPSFPDGAAVTADGFREKRLKNRDTAEGWAEGASDDVTSETSTADGDDAGTVAVVGDAILDESVLGRVEVVGDVALEKMVGDFGGFVGGGSAAGVFGVEDAFLLQKDNKPPPFLSLVRSAGSEFSSGSCLRSQPHSSFATAFWAFTDFSQSVEPLVACRCAMGLACAMGTKRVRRNVSLTDLATAVLLKGIGGGKEVTGIRESTSSVLQTKDK